MARVMSGSTEIPRLRRSHALVLEYGYIAVAIAMRLSSEPTANLSYAALATYALTGRARAIKALVLSWLFTMLSPGMGAEASFASIGRFLVVAAAAASVLFRSSLAHRHLETNHRRLESNRLVFATLLLGGFFMIHSLLFSPYPTVSVLKAVSWTVAMSTLLEAWMSLNDRERQQTALELFGGLALVMLVSLPLLATPLGYLRNGSGFQGILNHPQVFGLSMALLGVWAFSQLMTQARASWVFVALAATCSFLIFLSEARVAGVALVFGATLTVVVVPFFSRRRVTAVAPGLKSRRFALVASMMVLGLLLAGPDIGNRVNQYLAKGTASETLTEAYFTSRGYMIMKMWENIKKDPVSGIGFGIASDPWQMHIERDPVIGLPVEASIEKGVMPLAVWEEVGAAGFVAIAVWLFSLLRRSARAGISCLAVACTALFLNMGESTLFSPGGTGMLILVLLAWAATGIRYCNARIT